MEQEIKGLKGEDLAHLADTLNRKYRGFLSSRLHKLRFFEVSAHRDQRGVYGKVTLLNQDKSFYYPVEGRVADIDHDLMEKDAAMMLFDYMDLYFEEYLQKEEVYLPVDWTEFEYEGVPIQLRGQVYNLLLEKMASDLLGDELTL